MTARILVVDDVPANTRLLEAKLSAEYYQVVSARDGFEALETARDWQPDLILLDVMMPGMDGFECCRLVKAHSSTIHIPVIMITALGDRVERLRGLECGADDFLTKPVDYGTLMARIRSLVRLKRLLDEWHARAETARLLGFNQSASLSVGGAKVLLVDDQNLSAKIIEDALSVDGIKTYRVCHGDAAIPLASESAIDLIMLSLSLVDEDALKLLSALRAADGTHDTPIILLSDAECRDRLVRGFEMGANDWLITPPDQGELRARARNQIRRKSYQDRLRSDLGSALEMALADPLTGLYNRGFLRRHLSALIESELGRSISVVMIDVDHFKMINDQFGHLTGDRALRMIAETLRANCRPSDILARYGGEEFAVIMPDTSAEEAVIFSERFRLAIAALELKTDADNSATFTISIGIAHKRRECQSPDELLRRADCALYEAKHRGRNRVELAPRTTNSYDGR